jgi:hypothetical protein
VLHRLLCWLTGEPVRWRSEVFASASAHPDTAKVPMIEGPGGDSSTKLGVDTPYYGLVALTQHLQLGAE